MADATGPISTLAGTAHDVPAGMMCDDHPDRPAVARIQGETDSFGCEMVDVCQDCLEGLRAWRNSDEAREMRIGTCEWCKGQADDLRDARDYEEGMCGRVYRVCGACIKRVNDEAEAELDAMGYYDHDDYEPDDDTCRSCVGDGEVFDGDDYWFCNCAAGIKLKGEAEARYRAKSNAPVSREASDANSR